MGIFGAKSGRGEGWDWLVGSRDCFYTVREAFRQKVCWNQKERCWRVICVLPKTSLGWLTVQKSFASGRRLPVEKVIGQNEGRGLISSRTAGKVGWSPARFLLCSSLFVENWLSPVFGYWLDYVRDTMLWKVPSYNAVIEILRREFEWGYFCTIFDSRGW